jgi:hypothetical protein
MATKDSCEEDKTKVFIEEYTDENNVFHPAECVEKSGFGGGSTEKPTIGGRRRRRSSKASKASKKSRGSRKSRSSRRRRRGGRGAKQHGGVMPHPK